MDHGAGSDADHDVVRLVMCPLQEMNVIRRNKSKSQISCDVDEARAVAPLLLDPMVGQLDEEVLLAEDIPVGGGMFQGLGLLSGAQGHIDFSLEAAAQGDQSLGMSGEKFPVDARLVVEAVEVSRRADLDQIPVTLVVGGKEGHMVGDILAAVGGLLVLHRSGCDVDLATDDRLDLGLLGGLIELDRPEEISMVGQGDRRHAEFGRLSDELFHPDCTIQQRIFAVHMEMDERRLGHPINLRSQIPMGKCPRSGKSAVFGSNDSQSSQRQEEVHFVDDGLASTLCGKPGHQLGIPSGGKDIGAFSLEGFGSDSTDSLANQSDGP